MSDRIRFATEDGISLEGELRLPVETARASAVICHAHPQHGGSMDHPVLWAVRGELLSRRFAVLSFNFRGVMRSGGSFGGGRAEVRDIWAAVGRVRDATPGPTLVTGWSFGANVALREAITDERVGALALIGLPLDPGDISVPDLPGAAELRAFRRPALLVAGEGDPYAPRPALETLGRRLPFGEVRIVPGTDHFLWRRERAAAEAIGAFAERVLGEA